MAASFEEEFAARAAGLAAPVEGQRIVDGDTFVEDGAAKRVVGYNAPEYAGQRSKGLTQAYQAGAAPARDWLAENLPSADEIRNIGKDVYGRDLVEVRRGGENMALQAVRAGHGIAATETGRAGEAAQMMGVMGRARGQYAEGDQARMREEELFGRPQVDLRAGLNRHRAYNEPGTFDRALGRGVDQLKMMGSAAAHYMGEQFGIDAVSEWGLENFERSLLDVELNPREVANWTEIGEVNGALSDFGTWWLQTMGENLPNIAAMAATAGTGSVAAVAGKAVLGNLFKQSARQAITRAARGTGMAPYIKAAETTAKSSGLGLMPTTASGWGAAVGAGAGVYPMHLGEMAMELMEGDVDLSEATGLWLGAAVPTMLDTAGAAVLLNTLFRGVSKDLAKDLVAKQVSEGARLGAFKDIGQNLLKGAAVGSIEAPIEMMQEIAYMTARAYYDPNYSIDWSDPETQLRLSESFLAGGTVGASLGGAGRGGGAAVRRTFEGGINKLALLNDDVTEENVIQQDPDAPGSEMLGEALGTSTEGMSTEFDADAAATVRAEEEALGPVSEAPMPEAPADLVEAAVSAPEAAVSAPEVVVSAPDFAPIAARLHAGEKYSAVNATLTSAERAEIRAAYPGKSITSSLKQLRDAVPAAEEAVTETSPAPAIDDVARDAEERAAVRAEAELSEQIVAQEDAAAAAIAATAEAVAASEVPGAETAAAAVVETAPVAEAAAAEVADRPARLRARLEAKVEEIGNSRKKLQEFWTGLTEAARQDVVAAFGETDTPGVGRRIMKKVVDKVFPKAETATVAAITASKASTPVAEKPELPETGNRYLGKDKAKWAQATKFIGRGSESSSTAKYAKALGGAANSGQYTADDVVFVSAEGARGGRVAPDLVEIDKAVDAEATIITDDAPNRSRAYNVGEREVAAHLEAAGYGEVSPGRWQRVSEVADAPKPKLTEERATKIRSQFESSTYRKDDMTAAEREAIWSSFKPHWQRQVIEAFGVTKGSEAMDKAWGPVASLDKVAETAAPAPVASKKVTELSAAELKAQHEASAPTPEERVTTTRETRAAAKPAKPAKRKPRTSMAAIKDLVDAGQPVVIKKPSEKIKAFLLDVGYEETSPGTWQPEPGSKFKRPAVSKPVPKTPPKPRVEAKTEQDTAPLSVEKDTVVAHDATKPLPPKPAPKPKPKSVRTKPPPPKEEREAAKLAAAKEKERDLPGQPAGFPKAAAIAQDEHTLDADAASTLDAKSNEPIKIQPINFPLTRKVEGFSKPQPYAAGVQKSILAAAKQMLEHIKAVLPAFAAEVKMVDGAVVVESTLPAPQDNEVRALTVGQIRHLLTGAMTGVVKESNRVIFTGETHPQTEARIAENERLTEKQRDWFLTKATPAQILRKARTLRRAGALDKAGYQALSKAGEVGQFDSPQKTVVLKDTNELGEAWAARKNSREALFEIFKAADMKRRAQADKRPRQMFLDAPELVGFGSYELAGVGPQQLKANQLEQALLTGFGLLNDVFGFDFKGGRLDYSFENQKSALRWSERYDTGDQAQRAAVLEEIASQGLEGEGLQKFEKPAGEKGSEARYLQSLALQNHVLGQFARQARERARPPTKQEQQARVVALRARAKEAAEAEAAANPEAAPAKEPTLEELDRLSQLDQLGVTKETVLRPRKGKAGTTVSAVGRIERTSTWLREQDLAVQARMFWHLLGIQAPLRARWFVEASPSKIKEALGKLTDETMDPGSPLQKWLNTKGAELAAMKKAERRAKAQTWENGLRDVLIQEVQWQLDQGLIGVGTKDLSVEREITTLRKRFMKAEDAEAAMQLMKRLVERGLLQPAMAEKSVSPRVFGEAQSKQRRLAVQVLEIELRRSHPFMEEAGSPVVQDVEREGAFNQIETRAFQLEDTEDIFQEAASTSGAEGSGTPPLSTETAEKQNRRSTSTRGDTDAATTPNLPLKPQTKSSIASPLSRLGPKRTSVAAVALQKAVGGLLKAVGIDLGELSTMVGVNQTDLQALIGQLASEDAAKVFPKEALERNLHELRRMLTEDPPARVVFLSDGKVSRPFIYIKEGMKGTEIQNRMLLHEVGHIVMAHYLSSVTKDGTLKAMEEMFGPISDQVTFQENFANAFMRWAQDTAAGPESRDAAKAEVQGVVKQFFNKLWNALRKLWHRSKTEFPHDQTFAEFMELMMNRRRSDLGHNPLPSKLQKTEVGQRIYEAMVKEGLISDRQSALPSAVYLRSDALWNDSLNWTPFPKVREAHRRGAYGKAGKLFDKGHKTTFNVLKELNKYWSHIGKAYDSVLREMKNQKTGEALLTTTWFADQMRKVPGLAEKVVGNMTVTHQVRFMQQKYINRMHKIVDKYATKRTLWHAMPGVALPETHPVLAQAFEIMIDFENRKALMEGASSEVQAVVKQFEQLYKMMHDEATLKFGLKMGFQKNFVPMVYSASRSHKLGQEWFVTKVKEWVAKNPAEAREWYIRYVDPDLHTLAGKLTTMEKSIRRTSREVAFNEGEQAKLGTYLYQVFTRQDGVFHPHENQVGVSGDFASPGFQFRRARKLPNSLHTALGEARDRNLITVTAAYSMKMTERGAWHQRFGLHDELKAIERQFDEAKLMLARKRDGRYWSAEHFVRDYPQYQVVYDHGMRHYAAHRPGTRFTMDEMVNHGFAMAYHYQKRVQLEHAIQYDINIYDPTAGLKKRLLTHVNKGEMLATDYERFTKELLPGYLGVLGADGALGWRRLQQFLMVYQGIRVLSLGLFAQFVDLALVVSRAAPGYRSEVFPLIRDMFKADGVDKDGNPVGYKAMVEFAKDMGLWQRDVTQHLINDHMGMLAVSDKLGIANELFFRYNGMHYATNFMRMMSANLGKRLLQGYVRDGRKDLLAELNLTLEQGQQWVADGMPLDLGKGYDEVVGAIHQFTDESVIFPDASMRPRIGNDRRTAVFWHLKSFMYGYHMQVLQRAWNQAGTKWGQEEGAKKMYAAMPFIMLGAFSLPLAMMGMEMRWVISNPENRDPFGTMPYVWDAVQRSGMTGIPQMIVDADAAENYGRIGALSWLGPSFSHVEDLIASGFSSNSLWKSAPAYPIVNRIRNAF